MEPGLLRATPSYKPAGAGKEFYGRLVLLDLLVGLNATVGQGWQLEKEAGDAGGYNEGRQTLTTMPDSHHLQPSNPLTAEDPGILHQGTDHKLQPWT